MADYFTEKDSNTNKTESNASETENSMNENDAAECIKEPKIKIIDACGMYGVNCANLANLVDVAKDFAVFKGLCIRNKAVPFDARIQLPFCLVPSPFPEKWLDFVREIQPIMNYVLHQIAHSPEFLHSCLRSIIEEDDFVSNIWDICKAVHNDKFEQPISFGLLRCDYMLNTNHEGDIVGIKQIESNSIASSFSGMSSKVTDLHTFVLSRLGVPNIASKIPENSSYSHYAKGMVAAWDAYGRKKAAILFVVESIVYNICDQRAMEFAVWEIDKSIPVLRYSFAELRSFIKMQDGRLFVNNSEIAIVYYRCGYSPKHYSEKDWEVRLMMEKSLAIKCPSAAYHLAGSKRVQLELYKPGVLERFLPPGVNGDHIREVFAKQFALDMNREGNFSVALAMENPDHYVLKPEREGGGNNIFGENIQKKLEEIGTSESRAAYILMEKIRPPHILNCIVRSHAQPTISPVLCELGVYGVILGTKDKILKNYQAGHIIKSKEVGVDEGGIAAGFGALDSPYLM